MAVLHTTHAMARAEHQYPTRKLPITTKHSQIGHLTEFPAKQYSTSNNIINRPTIMPRKRNRPTGKLTNSHNLTRAEHSTRQTPITKHNLSLCAFHLYEPHIPTVNYNSSKRNRTTLKEMKTHTHTRIVVSRMGHVVVISEEALPGVCTSENRGGRF